MPLSPAIRPMIRTIAQHDGNQDLGSDFRSPLLRLLKSGIFPHERSPLVHTEPDGKILCTLCPRFCRIGEGQAVSVIFGKTSVEHSILLATAHPPVCHRSHRKKNRSIISLPGTEILSFGTAGCNLGAVSARTGA